jgi:hypothetical protein
MIHYHGTPITPDSAAAAILAGKHGLVSYSYPQQIGLVAEICQSFCLDNGAFTAWKQGTVPDWIGYYRWVEGWIHHPGFDFALVPDVIDGSEEANDKLLEEWPHGNLAGVPVWHMHESLKRLHNLCCQWPRVALGSSGKFSKVNNVLWWERMAEIMDTVCDKSGHPITKLHGLRMLNWRVFTKLPLSSADSSNIARNIGIDKHWRGTHLPINKAARGLVMVGIIEAHNSAEKWNRALLSAENDFHLETVQLIEGEEI